MDENISEPVKLIIKEAKRLGILRDKKEVLEAKLKEVNKEKSLLEEVTLPKLMDDYDIEKLSVKGVGTLYTQSGVYAYILADDREKVHAWFKKEGHSALVKESIHHSTLRSWVKEQLEEGKEVPEFLHAKPTTVARIRRS